MFCVAHHKSLSEAAAAGRELTPALRQHLFACEACRKAFSEQQSLFAAIDAGLRSVANMEVPVTLVPRVHVALNSETVARTHFQKWVFAGAALAAVLVVASVLKLDHANSAKENVAMTIPAGPTFRLKGSQPPARSAANGALRTRGDAEPVPMASVKLEASFAAQVLVPDEERAAFEKFLKRNQSVPVIVSAVSVVPEAPKELGPLQPVEIASLKVPSLSGEEASRDER